MGIADFVETVKEVGDVGIVKEGSGVIMVREAIGLRLIVSSCAGSDVGVELAEDEVEGEGGKDAAESLVQSLRIVGRRTRGSWV
jgi:hypothetical protein